MPPPTDETPRMAVARSVGVRSGTIACRRSRAPPFDFVSAVLVEVTGVGAVSVGIWFSCSWIRFADYRRPNASHPRPAVSNPPPTATPHPGTGPATGRSEEHTSELQSRQYLVC